MKLFFGCWVFLSSVFAYNSGLFGSQRQAMRAKQVAGGKSHEADVGGKKIEAKQLEGEVVLGDLIWVKLHGDSWWPAQVFDENAVSESSKPYDRPAQAVLVRLYGSYEYLYVDPITCHSEFEMVLKQNNGSCREIFEKALDQELLDLKSSRPKRKSSASTDRIHKGPKSNRPNAKEEVKSKNSKQRKVHKIFEPNSPGAKEEEKSRTRRQDGVQKITKQNYTNAEERSAGKFSRKDEFQKTLKSNSCTDEEDTNHRTPKQNQNEGPSLSRKVPELSARRLRVMQSLGLIAPSGSPFGKSGQICSSM